MIAYRTSFIAVGSTLRGSAVRVQAAFCKNTTVILSPATSGGVASCNAA